VAVLLISLYWYVLRCKHIYTSHDMIKIVVSILGTSNHTSHFFSTFTHTLAPSFPHHEYLAVT
jgi:hypothetical protein